MEAAVLQAMRGSPRAARRAGGERHALVVGAAGALGSAVLEKALGCGGFARVGALVTQPLGTALRGFEAVDFAGFDQVAAGAADTALIVFDRERRANGREQSFYRPQPEALVALARWLRTSGVLRLLVVLPHAPGLLPQALRLGLASLDEHALATLGFEQLVFVRSAAPAPPSRERQWLRRVARFVLGQLRWMVPQPEQPVRPETVATFTAQLALALADAAPATRVVPPELLWQAAQCDDVAALVREWLATGSWPAAPVRPPRM